MPDARNFGTLDVANFTVGAMLRVGIAIRKALRGSTSLQEAADTLCHLLYDSCVESDSGERSCALVRFYKTHPYGQLPLDDRRFAAAQVGGEAPDDEMRCLTLLGTAGDLPEWNARESSRGHRAIALPSAERIRSAPMILQLFQELGVNVEHFVSGPAAARAGETRTYDVFHVEHAGGSPFIPAQREFVEPHGIRSVVGFGGLLRSGELFALILFSKTTIPTPSAARFRTIALDVRSSLYSLDETVTWRT